MTPSPDAYADSKPAVCAVGSSTCATLTDQTPSVSSLQRDSLLFLRRMAKHDPPVVDSSKTLTVTRVRKTESRLASKVISGMLRAQPMGSTRVMREQNAGYRVRKTESRLASETMSGMLRAQPMGSTWAMRQIQIIILICSSAMANMPFAAGSSSKCAFIAIFNFGDSTSDTGAMHVSFPFMTLSEQPPYGETFFHRPMNRYSDGRLLIDFLVQGLGKPFLSPYLQSVDSNFTHGANFASSGATARDPFFISPFNLHTQVNQFKVFKQQVSEVKSDRRNYLPSRDAFRKGLYILEIGGNDFSYAYMRLKLTPEQIKSYLPSVVNSISNAIKELYEEGARTFWVLDVGPQGCLPFALTRYAYTEAELDEAGCAKPYNDAVVFYNHLLKAQMALLRRDLRNSDIIYVDTYDVQYSMIQNARRYGFDYTTRACCGVGGKHNYDPGVQCGSSNRLHGQYLTALSCVDPTQYINWDGIHLTDHGNRILAGEILSGTFFHPIFPLSKLCPSHLKSV